MAGKTTNLQLQKIDDTDYVGNFPTIYNNNLDLIDGLNIDKPWIALDDLNKLKDMIGVYFNSSGNYKELQIKKNFMIEYYAHYETNNGEKYYQFYNSGVFRKMNLRGNKDQYIMVGGNAQHVARSDSASDLKNGYCYIRTLNYYQGSQKDYVWIYLVTGQYVNKSIRITPTGIAYDNGLMFATDLHNFDPEKGKAYFRILYQG